MRSNSEAGPSTHHPAQHAIVAAAAAAADGDADDGDAHVQYGMGEQDEESDPYSLPVSHEVALEGECLPDLVAACMLSSTIAIVLRAEMAKKGGDELWMVRRVMLPSSKKHCMSHGLKDKLSDHLLHNDCCIIRLHLWQEDRWHAPYTCIVQGLCMSEFLEPFGHFALETCTIHLMPWLR